MNELEFNLNDQKILEVCFKNSKKNSFSPDASDVLLNGINKCTDLKGVLFYSSNDGVFCSGGDLEYYYRSSDAQPGIAANQRMTKNLNALAALPVATVALVDGLCIGGGVELLSCFDHIIASPKSMFSFWQRKIALTFGWGGARRLTSRMLKSDIKKFYLTTELFDCYRAKSLGLIDSVYESEFLLNEGREWLNKQTRLPQVTLSEFKSAEYYENESEVFAKTWFNEDHKAKLAKFMS